MYLATIWNNRKKRKKTMLYRKLHGCLFCFAFGWFLWFVFLINPFIVVLDTPSLRKRSITMPDWKSLRLFPPFEWAGERTSVKMHSIESRFVTGLSNIQDYRIYCLQECICALISPEILQAEAVKGLMVPHKERRRTAKCQQTKRAVFLFLSRLFLSGVSC